MEPDTVELAQFREQWKAEVQNKRKAPTDPAAQPGPSDPSRVHPAVLLATQKHPDPKRISPDAAQVGKVHGNTIVPSQKLHSALQIYRDAIHREQNGDLDDALVLYRKAFRLDPNVDRVYSREEKVAAALESQQAVPKKDAVVDGLAKDLSTSMTITTNRKRLSVAGVLANITSQFPSDLTFAQDDEKQPVWLRLLPDELLVSILRRLGVTSIERFALVCRKARMLTLDATLWREHVTRTYKFPQITQTDVLATIIERYGYSYRRMFIEQPRVRLDGVYIAICHYVRAGLSENQWVNISHLITYHRFLRFFPNGVVLSLLANEEMSPQQVIPILKPTLRMKGLSFGIWQLSGNTIQLNLVDANERLPESLPPSFAPLIDTLEMSEVQHSHRHVSHNHTSAVAEGRTYYMFAMTLELRSRPLGKWNRLDIESYDSVNLESGDTVPVALKHERPFWFSKVRSY